MALNATPVVSTSIGSASFVEGNNVASTPVVVDSSIVVSDIDNTTLASASVFISIGFQSSQDILVFTNPDVTTFGNIAASYNAGTGTLTLTSAGATATLAQWESALQAVTYVNSSEFPNGSNRTISFTVSDGTSTSNVSTKTVSVSSVNDTPVNSIPAQQSVDQDSSIIFSDANGNRISVSDADAGAGTVRAALTASNGLITLSSTAGLSFGVGDGASDGTMTFEGTIADINSALNGMAFSPTAGYNGAAALQIATSDLGNSGPGGTKSDTDTVAINVNSLNPRVTSVNSFYPDGEYKIGDFIYLTVSFDRTVLVDLTGGTPLLLLETGAIDSYASYISGSGSGTLTFTYIVQAGDLSTDLDFQSTGALALNGATIRNVIGDDAILTLPSPGAVNSLGGSKDFVIDGVAPTVTSIGSSTADGIYKTGDVISIQMNFSEAVTVTGTPQLTLETGTTDRTINYAGGTGTSQLTFFYTVQAGDTAADLDYISASALALNGGSIRDAVGNAADLVLPAPGSAGSLGANKSIMVDTIAPTVTIVLSDSSLTLGETATVTFTFSEAVTGFTLDDVTAPGGVLTGLSSSDGGITWTALFKAKDNLVDLTNIITVTGSGITDLAGNQMPGSTDSANFEINSRPTESDDILRLDSADDIVDALGGNDQVFGGGGDDLLKGGSGHDILKGGRGGDTLLGGTGKDWLNGGRGADHLDGGAGPADTASYADSATGVTVNLETGAGSGGDAAGDTLAGIENLTGSAHDDTLTGNDGRNILKGGGGDDTMTGGAGHDLLIGGKGNDDFVLTPPRPTAIGLDDDVVFDFRSGEDRLAVSAATFGNGLIAGSLLPEQFVSNATGVADDPDVRFIFDTTTDKLYFDADGSGNTFNPYLLATFKGNIPDLVYTDFVVI